MIDTELNPVLPEPDMPTKVCVTGSLNQYNMWSWASDNLEIGTWRTMISILGTSTSFYFDRPEDAVMFKLRFSI